VIKRLTVDFDDIVDADSVQSDDGVRDAHVHGIDPPAARESGKYSDCANGLSPASARPAPMSMPPTRTNNRSVATGLVV